MRILGDFKTFKTSLNEKFNFNTSPFYEIFDLELSFSHKMAKNTRGFSLAKNCDHSKIELFTKLKIWLFRNHLGKN